MADSFQTQMPIKPDQILDIIIRRKWLIVIPLCISLTVGLFFTLTAKKTYEASTLILVQPQRVPKNYVQSVVTSTIGERISTISQQILSRSNLEKIIDQFGLFENSPGMYLEDKIANMRNRVKVRIERSGRRGGGGEAFSIVFNGSEPQRVMRIANTLASYFMDENLKVREAQAVGTSEFLDSELEKTRKRLEEREQRLAEYRAKYLGGLPDELESNLRTLDRLQNQITAKGELLRQTRDALRLNEEQISQTEQYLAEQKKIASEKAASDGNPMLTATEDEQKLQIAQNQYDALLLKYTDKHPDVQKVIKTIEKLKQSIADKKSKEETEGKTPEVKKDTLPATKGELLIAEKKTQSAQLKRDIREIQEDIVKIEQAMKVYQRRVEETPKRELELQALQRDYSNIQEIFNSLLDRKLEAELSVNMEKKQKGEQFRILDHARLPEKPISPNVKMLFLLSVASGLGFGVGMVFLLEFFDNSIRNEEQIESDLGLTLLANIPELKKPKDKMKKIITNAVFSIVLGYAIVFLTFFAVLNAKGLDRTINFIKSTLSL